MDKKITAIVAYAGILGGLFGLLDGIGKLCMVIPLIIWFIAYSVGDKEGAKIHLNQSLIIVILGLACGIVCLVLGLIPVIDKIAQILDIVVKAITLVFSIWGIYLAVKEEDKKLPIIGEITILK